MVNSLMLVQSHRRVAVNDPFFFAQILPRKSFGSNMSAKAAIRARAKFR